MHGNAPASHSARSRQSKIPRWPWASGLIALLAITLAAACSKQEPGSASGSGSGESQEQTIIVSQGSDVLSMDPYKHNESPTLGVLINIYDPLTDISKDLKVVPALAESWENVEPTVWEFKLRKGVKFHNGNDFDAEDVRYTILRARDWPQSRQTAEVATVKDVVIVDPHTIRIETTVPDAILPTRLISIYILDKETCEPHTTAGDEAWLSTHAIGTGPYKLEKWERGSFCQITAFAEHWRGKPTVEKIRYVAVSNDATRVAKFLDGEIDILSNVPVRDVERVRATPGYRVISKPSLRLIYLGLDTGRDESPSIASSPPNPLLDLRVRQAIYQAIDMDLIVEKVMSRQAAVADQLFPQGVIGHIKDLGRPPLDRDAARALLAEAGYPEGFDIRLDAPNDRYVNDDEVAAAIAGQLAKINIRVQVNARPKSSFFADEQNGLLSFFLIGWTNPNGDGYGTFDHLLHTVDQEKRLGMANLCTRYSNPELDRLTEAAASEFDPEKRTQLLESAVRIAMRDLPHIPLHYQMDIYAISDKLDWTPRRDTQVRGIDLTRKAPTPAGG